MDLERCTEQCIERHEHMTEMFKRSLPLEDAYNALQRSHIFQPSASHQEVTPLEVTRKEDYTSAACTAKLLQVTGDGVLGSDQSKQDA